jgi:hypothetical protein
MQHEAAIGLHRAAEIDRKLADIRRLSGTSIFSNSVAEIHVDRAVDDQPERALIVVLGNIDQRFGKIRVIHCRHGNEKMIGEIHALHSRTYFNRRMRRYKGNPCSIPSLSGSGAICATTTMPRSVRSPAPGAFRYCAFVFDRDILDALPNTHDRRVEFIHESLLELDLALCSGAAAASSFGTRARRRDSRNWRTNSRRAVFANRDYEPQAKRRDAAVAMAERARHRNSSAFKDQVAL